MSQFFTVLTSGSIPPSIATQYITDNGTAVPAANILNVLGGTGATTSGIGNTITVTVKNEGFTWSEQNVSFSASIQNGYFCNAALTVSLPASGGLVIGNTIIIYVDTDAAVIVQANTGQSIQIGDGVSSAGGTATCTALQKGSILELIFKPTDLTWHTQSSLGSWILA